MKLSNRLEKRPLFRVLLLVWCVGLCDARGVELGEPAPPIHVSEWVNGSPVTLARGSNIYVLDFWLPDTSNSRYTVPYVSNLQRAFRDQGVIMLGIVTDPPARVKKFLRSLDTPIEHTQGVDVKQQTTLTYLGRPNDESVASASDLPHAFVIDREGRVAWHGNSTVALEQVLKEILAGTFKIEAARREIAAEKAAKEYFALVMSGSNPLRMLELGDQVITNAWDHANILNEFAWRIVSDRKIKTASRAYQLALRASQRAYDLSGGTEIPIMDTYARALFQAGRRSEAMEIEKKAIAVCKDPRYRPQLESVLTRFERLSRTPPAK